MSLHAERRPDAPALSCVDTGDHLTWADFDSQVGKLAGLLLDGFGVQRGDRVAVLAENDVRTFIVHFACIRAGAIFVPLNYRLATAELLATVDDCAPVVLIHDDVYAEPATEIARARPSIRHRIGWRCPGFDLDAEASASRYVPGALLDPEALTHITYTSGSTGLPKGVTSANRMMLWHALNMAHTSRFAERDGHHLNLLPLFWGGGLCTFTAPMLYWGGQVTTVRRFDERTALGLLADGGPGITHLCGVPEMYQRMADLDDFDRSTFSALRTALVGAWRPDFPALHARWRERGVFLQVAYGSSEMGPNVAMMQTTDPRRIESRSSGMPVPFMEISLRDESWREVEPGEVGEICVRGPAVTSGYWNQPKDGVFVDGWFRSGDLGRFGPEGDLYVVGRTMEVIRSGGTNVYPGEIERVLQECPGVEEVAVVAVPDPSFGQVGLAVVVPAADVEVTLETLNDFAEGRLARYKRPRHLMLVDALPRTATEKVARQRLRDLFAQRTGGNADLGELRPAPLIDRRG